MTTRGIVIASRPIGSKDGPGLYLDVDGRLTWFPLHHHQQLTITVEDVPKMCRGWYDIETHQNHLCESHLVANDKYESCFACRKKTDFNPAFYHAQAISAKQARYNDAPHSVYIAYFGQGLAKAGIMSDSRGLDRLYEQGALFYCIVAHKKNATEAHNLEAQLIRTGLRDSIQKRQKAALLQTAIDCAKERAQFTKVLEHLGYDASSIASPIDEFFFGKYLAEPIESFGHRRISGVIVGIVGGYMVFENHGRRYGIWSDSLYGHTVELTNAIMLINPAPQQMGLF